MLCSFHCPPWGRRTCRPIGASTGSISSWWRRRSCTCTGATGANQPRASSQSGTRAFKANLLRLGSHIISSAAVFHLACSRTCQDQLIKCGFLPQPLEGVVGGQRVRREEDGLHMHKQVTFDWYGDVKAQHDELMKCLLMPRQRVTVIARGRHGHCNTGRCASRCPRQSQVQCTSLWCAHLRDSAAGVAAGADKAVHQAAGAQRHERHDAEGRTAGALHEDAEQHHNNLQSQTNWIL